MVSKRINKFLNKYGIDKYTDYLQTPIGICHIINGLYGGAFTIQIAMLPFLILDMGSSLQLNGLVAAVFSILQFFGSVLFGRIADSMGPSLALLVANASSTVMYASMSVSVHPWMLLTSQIPSFFMQGFQAAALLVCYETPPSRRTPLIAYLNLSYGIGAVIGAFQAAALVGYIGARGTLLSATILTTIACFFANELEAFKELHPVQTAPPILGMVTEAKKEFSRFYDIIKKSLSICILMIVGLFPILMTRFSFVPLAVDAFSLTAISTSYLVVYIGILTIFAEGLLAPYLATMFGDITCCKFGIIIATLGFILLTLSGTNKILVLLSISLPLCGGALLYVCATSQMTKRVEQNEIGSVLGINGAIFYFTAGTSPMVAIYLYKAGGIVLYWGICAICSILLCIYLLVIDERTINAYSWDPPSTTFEEFNSYQNYPPGNTNII